VERLPRPGRTEVTNPLVNAYCTRDGRFLSLCMLQSERYWQRFCELVGRHDLLKDPRFETDKARSRNAAVCIGELDALFRTKTLAEWCEILERQDGQWDVVQHVGELKNDRQVEANGYMQPVDYGDGRILNMVSVPAQFDGVPLPARPAPELGAHSEEILTSLGYDQERIIELKVAGVVL